MVSGAGRLALRRRHVTELTVVSRGIRTWRWAVVVALLFVGLPPPVRGEALYRRATVLEGRVGKVSVRSAYGVRLDVLANCAGNPTGRGEQVYDAVFRMDFASERHEALDAEVARTEEPRGSILLGVKFSQSDLATFKDELDGWTRKLSAEAFVEPFAGLALMTTPFDGPTLGARAERPTWVCFESGESSAAGCFDRRVEVGPDGPAVVGTAVHTYTKPPTPVCEQMRAATEGSLPQVVETMLVPGRVSEVVVDYAEVVRIDSVDPEALAARPEGMLLFKRRFPEGITASASGTGGGLAHVTCTEGGWKWDAYTAPATLPLDALDTNAWLFRWTVETVERQLGPHPKERIVSRTSASVAYLPTLPAALVEAPSDGAISNDEEPPAEFTQPRAEGPATVDRQGFLDSIAARLERYRGEPRVLLDELVRRPERGLESEGWIVVICPDDGPASYHLPPTTASGRLTNADLFCAALEARLLESAD